MEDRGSEKIGTTDSVFGTNARVRHSTACQEREYRVPACTGDTRFGIGAKGIRESSFGRERPIRLSEALTSNVRFDPKLNSGRPVSTEANRNNWVQTRLARSLGFPDTGSV